jgi:hypothetical protein
MERKCDGMSFFNSAKTSMANCSVIRAARDEISKGGEIVSEMLPKFANERVADSGLFQQTEIFTCWGEMSLGRNDNQTMSSVTV